MEDRLIEIECFCSSKLGDKHVCPYRTLKKYIHAAEAVRNSRKVFVTTTKGTPVAPATMARWTKQAMESAGIDTDFFKPYSTRSAAVSKKASQGTSSLKDVLKMGNWRGTSSFFRFYLCRVVYFTPSSLPVCSILTVTVVVFVRRIMQQEMLPKPGGVHVAAGAAGCLTVTVLMEKVS